MLANQPAAANAPPAMICLWSPSPRSACSFSSLAELGWASAEVMRGTCSDRSATKLLVKANLHRTSWFACWRCCMATVSQHCYMPVPTSSRVPACHRNYQLYHTAVPQCYQGLMKFQRLLGLCLAARISLPAPPAAATAAARFALLPQQRHGHIGNPATHPQPWLTLICALVARMSLPAAPPAAEPAAATFALLPGRELLLSDMLDTEAEGTATK